MVSENPDTEDDLSEIRALNSGKTSASGETVGYRSNPQVPLNQKGMLFHSLLSIHKILTFAFRIVLCFQLCKI